jgi:hypothetical protein
MPIFEDDRVEHFSTLGAMPRRNIDLARIIEQINIMLRQQ